MTRTSRHPRRLPALLAALAVLALVAVGCGDDDGGGGGGGGSAVSPFGSAPPSGAAPGSTGAARGTLPPFDASGPDYARGMAAPEVTGRTLAGEEMTIGADGTAKVILFVAHWCPHCQAEVPRVVEHLAETPMPDDVELIGVSTAERPGGPKHPPEKWLEEENWTAPTLDDVDGTVSAKFGLSSYPFFVAVDSDGKVVARGSGELTMEQFDQLVEAASSGSL